MKLKNIWFKSIFWKLLVVKNQENYLDKTLKHISDSVIIFLCPSDNKVNGGVISIASLAEESKKLKYIHLSDVFVCSLPGEPYLFRFTKFKNSVFIVQLHQLLSRLVGTNSVLIHIPEIFVEKFSIQMKSIQLIYPFLKWRFNILLQNIDLVPSKESVDILSTIGSVTCTTAHLAYSNKTTEAVIGCPVHHFSAWCSPEQYAYKSFQDKENIIVVSPDKHPRRDEVLDHLKRKLHGYDFHVIRKMTYEEYKGLISRAKYSLTFGEGLDGYFTEIIFSGGIGSSVYNDRFFTEEFRMLPFVYRSWDEFKDYFPQDVKSTNTLTKYQDAHLKQFKLLASIYSHDKYVINLIKFYKKIYQGLEKLTD